MTTSSEGQTPQSHPPEARAEPPNAPGTSGVRLRRAAQVIIISSVMFSFISYWRTAAVVLCDLASTAYYIGGIVELSIGPAAPWFILGVMFFSYAVRSVYIESCTLFVRGGVYRVVREALGKFMAKIAVSALMFDYILTGPISGVSAGQYVLGLAFDVYVESTGSREQVKHAEAEKQHAEGQLRHETDPRRRPALEERLYQADRALQGVQGKLDNMTGAFKPFKSWGSVLLAVAATLYFFRQNIIGIHESSDKALKIMIATTVMAVIMLSWCGLTLAVKGRATQDGTPNTPRNTVLVPPDFHPKENPATGEKEDPTGFLKNTRLADELRRLTPDPPEGAPEGTVRPSGPDTVPWLSLIGFIGILIAFGHSILAMSGEETLAQVYREVESPKLTNFKKAAFVVFLYSLVLTAGISFLAVLLIPDAVRMKDYSDNLIGGLAMSVWGPPWARLLLNGFVVVVGSLILAGAVNTAIIGSNGVLNRVAEDGVMPDWFLKPHRRYGTTYRVLYLIVGLQLVTIIASRGDVLLLGEAYAFGVVWSFVFQALAMVVLRFTDRRPREAKVPFNVKVGTVEVPLGLIVILVILVLSAIANLLTKEVATIGGVIFTSVFFTIFYISERYHEGHRRGARHTHLEQFNQQTAGEVTPHSLGLTKQYRKLVSIRSTQNLFMLEKSLAETDPETTGVVVMTAKVTAPGDLAYDQADLDRYDQQLMTAVVDRAEKAGKQVRPLIVPTNNPLHAVLNTAKDLQAHELVMGASNKYTADEQLEQVAFYWISLHDGSPAPLTVRILGRDRDMYLDLAGGNRIPKISERKARSVAELRAAGVGVDRVLMVHDGSPSSSDLFQAVLTMLDPEVLLGVVPAVPAGPEPLNGHGLIRQDEERARHLSRALRVIQLAEPTGAEIVRRAREDQYDLIIVPLSAESPADPTGATDERTRYIVSHAHCRVLLGPNPVIPQEVVDTTPSSQ